MATRARQLRHAPCLHDLEVELIGHLILQLLAQRRGATKDIPH